MKGKSQILRESVEKIKVNRREIIKKVMRGDVVVSHLTFKGVTRKALDTRLLRQTKSCSSF